MPGPIWYWENRGVILPGHGDVVAEHRAFHSEDGGRGA